MKIESLSGPGRARRSGYAEAPGYGEAGQTDWFHIKVEAQANEQTAEC